MYLVIDTAFLPTVECIVCTRDEAAIFVEKKRKQYHNNFNAFFRWSEELERFQTECFPYKDSFTLKEEEAIRKEYIAKYGEKKAPLVQHLYIVQICERSIINYLVEITV